MRTRKESIERFIKEIRANNAREKRGSILPECAEHERRNLIEALWGEEQIRRRHEVD